MAPRLLSRRKRYQAIRRAQHAPAFPEIELLDRLVEAQPADPAILERLGAAGVGHEEVHDRDPVPFLLLLDAAQAPDRPRAHARLLADLAQRGDGGRFTVLDVALGKEISPARATRLDEQIARPIARHLEDDASSVRRAVRHLCLNNSREPTQVSLVLAPV